MVFELRERAPYALHTCLAFPARLEVFLWLGLNGRMDWQDHHENTAKLLARLRAGDDSAREALLECWEDRLRYFVHHMLGGFPKVHFYEQTDDVLNQAMLGIWKSLNKVQFDSPEGFVFWVRKRVRWSLLDLTKKYAKHNPAALVGSQVDYGWAPGLKTLGPTSLAEWTHLHELIEALEGEERAVFEMHFYEGLTFATIAEELGKPLSTVKYRWKKSLEWVQCRLKAAQLD